MQHENQTVKLSSEWKSLKKFQKQKLYKIDTKLKTCTYIQNKLIFRIPWWGILRYCLCFHKKNKLVNWARQVRDVSQSFSFVVQL